GDWRRSLLSMMNKNDSAPLRLKTKIHPPQCSKRPADRFVPFRWSVKHKEPASSGPKQLAANRPCLPRLRVPLVHLARRDAPGQLSFQTPAFVDDFPERIEPVFLQITPKLISQLHHPLHRGLFLLCVY